MPARIRLLGNLYNPIVPAGAISIVRPGRFGNPFKVIDGNAIEAVKLFEEALLAGKLKFTLIEVKEKLAGKNLACWCKVGEICHGDVLLKFANE